MLAGRRAKAFLQAAGSIPRQTAKTLSSVEPAAANPAITATQGAAAAAVPAAGTLAQAGHVAEAARVATSAWRAGVSAGDIANANRLSLPVAALAGIFGSVAVCLSGSGGAAVIAPLISRGSPGIPQRVIAGTSLAAVLSTALTSTATFSASGCIDPVASLAITLPAIALAPLGARLTSRLDCAALKRLLGYFLLAAAPLIPLKSWLFSTQQPAEQPLPEGDPAKGGSLDISAASLQGSLTDDHVAVSVAAPGLAAAPEIGPQAAEGQGAPSLIGWVHRLWQQAPDGRVVAGLAAAGGAAGFTSGLLGIGGGTVATPLVALLMPWAQATVLGTTLLAMIPPTAVGMLQHHRLGNIDWRLAGLFAAGASVGAAAGSAAAVHSPSGILEGCFTVAMHYAAQPAVAVYEDVSSSPAPVVQQSVQGAFQSYVVPLYNLDKQQVGQQVLDGSIFDVPIRKDILHRVVRWQLARRQQGTHKTKTRSEVRGGGRKPRPQKGSGQSRQGTIRAPQWRGGGTAHGPVLRSHEHKLFKRVRRLGLKCALSAKLWEGRLLVLDSLRPETAKTKVMDAHVSALLAGAPRRSAVFVDSAVDGPDGGELLRRSIRNLPWMEVLPARGLNVYSILQRDYLIMSRQAVDAVVTRLNSPLKPWSPKP
ncbi:hypothetical protein N2152v2_004792 [Parachlorella kessleri]